MNIILTLIVCALFAASTASGFKAIGRPRAPYSRGAFASDTAVLGVLTVLVIVFTYRGV